jgi:SAM-dependent methyltransferase
LITAMAGPDASELEPAGDAYLFPRGSIEIDRLDVQHYALREALGGNYLAPVGTPGRLLDVGCGTGQWAFDVGAEFPAALVVGLDLAPSKPGGPAGYRFVRANLLQGLPFADDSFDFVHQRLLVSGVPRAAWPVVVGDLVRVTRPGGWVELVEVGPALEPAGAATERMYGLMLRLAATLGLDTEGAVFDSLDGYLREAGLVGVHRRRIDVPVGEWGDRVGSLMASDLRAACARMGPVIQVTFGLSQEEFDDLLRTMQTEWEERRSRWAFAFAYGHKWQSSESA